MINALNNSGFGSYFGMLISNCKNTKFSFNNFLCSHVKREVIIVTHLLAKFALSQTIWAEKILIVFLKL